MDGGGLGQARGEIVLDASKAIAATRQTEQAVNAMASSTTKAGMSTGKALQGLGGPMVAVGAAVAGAAGLAVKGFMDVQTGMANVNSIAQLTDDQLASLTDQVLNIATATAKGPADLAAGLYDIYSSGFQGAEALDILTASANAATAGVTSTAVASAAVVQVMNVYGDAAGSATDVSDVLFQVVNDGVVTFEQLATQMSNVLPTANALGVGIDEVGAAYATMTKSGVTAAQSETQIAGLMRSALGPTDALTTAVKAAGYESAESMIATEGFGKYIEFLGEASGGSKTELFNLLGTQEAMNAALILGKDGASGYNDEVDRMKDSSGATEKALDKQTQTLAYQMAELSTAMDIAKYRIGNALAPAVGVAVTALTKLLAIFDKLSPSTQKVIVIATTVAGAITGIAGAAILAYPKLVQLGEGFKALGMAIRGIATANPWILALVAAIALLVVAYKTNFLGFADGVDYVIGRIKDGFAAIKGVVDTFITNWNVLRQATDPVTAALYTLDGMLTRLGGHHPPEWLATIIDLLHVAEFSVRRFVARFLRGFGQITRGAELIKKAFGKRGLRGAFDELFGRGGKMILRGIGNMASAIPKLAGDFLRNMKTGFGPLDGFLNNIGRMFLDVAAIIQAIFRGQWGKALDSAKNLLGHFVDSVKGYLGLLKGIFNAIPWGALWDALKTGASAAWDFVKGVIGSAVDAIAGVDWGGLLSGLLDRASQLFTITIKTAARIIGWVKDHARNVWEGIKKAVGWVAPKIAEAFTVTIKTAARIIGWAKDHARDVWGGIKRAVGWAANVASQAFAITISTTANIIGWAKDHAGDVWGGIKSAVGWVQKTYNEVVTVVVDAVIQLSANVRTIASDFGGWVWKQIKGGWNGIVEAGTITVDATLDLKDKEAKSDSFARRVGDGIVSAVRAITDLASRIGSAIAGFITDMDWAHWITADSFNLGEAFGTAIHNAIVGSAGIAVQLVTGLVDILTGTDWTKVATAVGVGIAAAVLAVPTVAAAVTTAIYSFLVGAIKGIVFGDADFSTVVSKVGSGLKSAFSSTMDWASGVITQIAASLFSTVTGTTFVSLGLAIASAIWNALVDIVSGWSVSDLLAHVPGINIAAADPANKEADPNPPVFTVPSGGYEQLPVVDAVGQYLNAPDELKKFTDNAQEAMDAWEKSKSSITANFSKIKTSATTEFPAASTAVSTFKSKMENDFVGLRTSLTTLSSGIRAAVTNEFIGLRTDATSISMSMVAAVANEFVGMRSQTVSLMTGMNAGIANQFVGMRSAVVAISTGMSSGVANAFVGMRNSAVSIATGLATGVTNQFVGMRNNAVSIAAGMSAGVANQFVGMRSAMMSITESAVSAVLGALRSMGGSAGSIGYGVGSDLGRGIYNGINSWIGAIAGAAANAVNQAEAAARSAADAKSPSRLMQRFGVDFLAGGVLGIDDTAPALAASTRDAVSRALAAANATLAGATVTPTGTGAAIVSGVPGASTVNNYRTFNVTVPMDVNRIGDFVSVIETLESLESQLDVAAGPKRR